MVKKKLCLTPLSIPSHKLKLELISAEKSLFFPDNLQQLWDLQSFPKLPVTFAVTAHGTRECLVFFSYTISLAIMDCGDPVKDVSGITAKWTRELKPARPVLHSAKTAAIWRR